MKKWIALLLSSVVLCSSCSLSIGNSTPSGYYYLTKVEKRNDGELTDSYELDIVDSYSFTRIYFDNNFFYYEIFSQYGSSYTFTGVEYVEKLKNGVYQGSVETVRVYTGTETKEMIMKSNTYYCSKKEIKKVAYSASGEATYYYTK